jgi:hypothetical protein
VRPVACDSWPRCAAAVAIYTPPRTGCSPVSLTCALMGLFARLFGCFTSPPYAQAPAANTTYSSVTASSVAEPAPTEVASLKKAAPPKKAAASPKSAPYTPAAASALFAKYADEDEPTEIGPEGLEALCADGCIPLDGALPLVLAWQLGAKEMGKFSQEEWAAGMGALQCVGPFIVMVPG